MTHTRKRILRLTLATAPLLAALVLVACEHAKHFRGSQPYDTEYVKKVSDPAQARDELSRIMAPPAPGVGEQTSEEALTRSRGCITCHGEMDEPDMHDSKVAVGCVDCHGGDGSVVSTLAAAGRPGKPGTPIEDGDYLAAMRRAHVQPRNPEAWYGRAQLAEGTRDFGSHHGNSNSVDPNHAHDDPTRLHGSRNPEITYALLNHESPQFIRFINPGDLRIADFTCGACHPETVAKVRHSMMNHGAMLWGTALYSNGAIPNKTPRYGESYSAFGLPQRLQGVIEKAEWDKDSKQLKVEARWPTKYESLMKGVLPSLEPLPAWNVSQPGNILRVFERGNKLPVPGGPTPNPNPAEIGNPNPLVEGGRPDKGLSPRGLGTLNRTDPVFLGLQKTRLLDPLLSFLGTNDHPGDYRSSGCTACHSPYANDRDPYHSGPLAQFGHMGRSASNDPTIAKDEPGHPIKHTFTNAIPNSQCVVCHIHPGTSYANTYLGYMWWDNESDGEHMYPKRSHNPTPAQEWLALMHNPEGAQLKGLWGNLYPDAESHTGEKAGPLFLEKIGEPRADAVDPLAKPQAAADAANPKPETRDPKPATFNDKLTHNQFADFHGHGWVFRAVFKKDRQGNLLTRDGKIIDPDDPDKWMQAVHLKDVHLERGMHCVDCHFSQDAHGDGKLYGEARNAIEITCVDCHGTQDRPSNLRTSGPASPDGGTDLSKMRVGPLRLKRFEKKGSKIIQRSTLNPDVEWVIPQTVDTNNPDSAWSQNPENIEAAKRARYAHTIRRDGQTWGSLPAAGSDAFHGKTMLALAHRNENVACFTCHTSWMTSCFGCHLPMSANRRMPMLHNENMYARNWTQYNYQVLRDDVFMLGRDGTFVSGKVDAEGHATPGRIVPVRSSSAVLVASQNANREWIYHQQQTVSSGGYSGQVFNPHFPHATGGRGTTKMCTDCHISAAGDNNAWMAQLFLQGTNFVNFLGRYVYVAEGEEGLQGVAVTEHDEPQAVYGSRLHELAYPDEYKAFVDGGRDLSQGPLDDAMFHHHAAGAGELATGYEILDLQHRGEYLYAARGRGGLYVFDIANIDNKGFSERITSAPVSPLGQRLGFKTKYAVAIASPSTLAVDPARGRYSTDPSKPRAGVMEARQPWHPNQEQAVHPMYAYLYVGDRYEGLILTFAGTLLDGDPNNNFLERATLKDGTTAFNPRATSFQGGGNLLDGLTSLTLAGHYAYVTAKAGLVVIDLDDPLSPTVVAVVQGLRDPRHVAVQFRYAFVTDADGLKVVDITEPTKPRLVEGAQVALTDAHRVYLARTYAMVAAGKAGLAIIDITHAEQPALQQLFNADGAIGDARDVKVGMTNATLYAYVADAGDSTQGLKVLEMMGPHTTPQFRGFAPPLSPRLIAQHHTHGRALAISKGLDRDRAVDETGHQVAVFGRIGARPLTLGEMQSMYLRDGKVWTVTDEPATEPKPFDSGDDATGTPTPKPGPRPGPTPGPRPGPAPGPKPGPRPGPAPK